MPTIRDSAYDRHRRIGQGDPSAPAAFHPRLGATLDLFGSPVTLGPYHALALVAAGALSGLEGVLAVIVLFFGWLLLRQTASSADALHVPTPTRPSARAVRQPGLWGWLMHLVGPVPEGAPITMSEVLTGESAAPAATPVPARPAGTGASPSAPPQTPSASAPWTAKDEAKASAARASAARAAAARAAAARAEAATGDAWR
jgi:hypothetical protein